jgi:hypothetical protein
LHYPPFCGSCLATADVAFPIVPALTRRGSVAKAAKVVECVSRQPSSEKAKTVLRCRQCVVRVCAHIPCDSRMRFAACLCQTCFFWWSAVVSKVTCGASNVWQGKLAERACLCMCLQSISPAVVPRLKTTATTTSHAMVLRSSSRLRSALLWEEIRRRCNMRTCSTHSGTYGRCQLLGAQCRVKCRDKIMLINSVCVGIRVAECIRLRSRSKV